MTLSEMRKRVREATGGRKDIDATIDFYLNEAMYQLVWEKRPHEAVATATFTTDATSEGVFDFEPDVVGTNDIYAILLVRNDTKNRLLREGSLEEYEDRDQSDTGEPTKWFRRANQLILYDAPPDNNDGSHYSIRVTYLKRLNKMDLDSEVFPLNDEWIRPVEALAAAMIWGHLNKFEYAAVKAQEYISFTGQRQTPKQIEDESPESGMQFWDSTRYD